MRSERPIFASIAVECLEGSAGYQKATGAALSDGIALSSTSASSPSAYWGRAWIASRCRGLRLAP